MHACLPGSKCSLCVAARCRAQGNVRRIGDVVVIGRSEIDEAGEVRGDSVEGGDVVEP